MADEVLKDDGSFIMKMILMFLAPANKASMITLNITLVLVWILIGMSIYYKYYNIHVYIIGVMTTVLILFVNYFATVINDSIPPEDEKKED
ncbi:hypothetical protein AV274_3453 [Blastocystis sp. ATCC 50177/Nand II]|uniref:Uncharacterized protein n=1 Tax=Blastocystis sp. subtype 1 (strain ATCC 50177 / NandII) TaxID=478820 RepID=A0A196SCH8_BLAHN|nr:hypothetical protein AV274_3453 [Blastocystis sp. ATCC 50177/Nand II]